jgi:aminoglycoside 6-adenylyltransferase
MTNRVQEQEAISRFIHWGKQQDAVRAMLLTSTLAIPNGQIDLLSDFDIILVLTDIHPFFESRAWLEAFGRVLALYRDPIQLEEGLETSGYVIQFEEGLKIDFTLWHVEHLRRVAAAPQLPDELDAGYRILLDKDGLTESLKPPTYKAYIPTPPTEQKYQDTIEMFFLDTTYVAKFLWRDDMMAAKELLDHYVKQEHLRPMLEWHMEIDHGWSVKPSPYGRRLKQWIRPDLWSELEVTYTGMGIDANWEALYRTIALFRRVAIEVGDRLGYAYPHDLDRRVIAHLEKVKRLDRGAETFS